MKSKLRTEGVMQNRQEETLLYCQKYHSQDAEKPIERACVKTLFSSFMREPIG